MADALIGLIGQSYYDALAELTAFPSGPDAEEIDDPEVESDFGPTFKEQLVRARRGQGVFRSSVLLSETECRVTRVADPKHLRCGMTQILPPVLSEQRESKGLVLVRRRCHHRQRETEVNP